TRAVGCRTNPESRSVAHTDVVLFDGERTLCGIEREILMVATEVVIDLGLATTHRVNRHADAWRPLTRERVLAARTDEARRDTSNLGSLGINLFTVDVLLLPAQADERRDVLVEAPRILHVGGVV